MSRPDGKKGEKRTKELRQRFCLEMGKKIKVPRVGCSPAKEPFNWLPPSRKNAWGVYLSIALQYSE